MGVLTKAKKPNKRPRCEAKNAKGQRCAFQSVEYVGPWCFCKVHAAKARNKGRNPWQIINKDA